MLCHPEGELYRRATQYAQLTVIPERIGRLSFLDPLLMRRLKRLFRQERLDALIMNLPADLKTAGRAARACAVRHIIYRRGSALPVRDSLFNRYLYGRVITRLIVNSLATQNQTLANNPALIPQERITVLPNGVDVAAFDAALAAAQLPGECERTGEGAPFVIGSAGRLTRQKGQHLLLYLAKNLQEAGLSFRLLIAGEGEREQELKELRARLGLEEEVVFYGFIADLSPFWRRIDLFVLSSLWEGFGNVLIEAMLAEKPVFAFAVSNIPELVFEGPEGNGQLFPLPEEEWMQCPDARRFKVETQNKAGQAAASGAFGGGFTAEGEEAPLARVWDSPSLKDMAEAVLALARNHEEARRMGRAGRAFARRFSQESCMDVLEGLLR